jgi:hypothetical protein
VYKGLLNSDSPLRLVRRFVSDLHTAHWRDMQSWVNPWQSMIGWTGTAHTIVLPKKWCD